MEWRVIPGFDNYEASNLGHIRNHTTKKILKPYYVENSYAQVRLSLGSKHLYKLCRVHRLVALAWIPNKDNKETVNHKNKNKIDNRVDNLEWLDYREQACHHESMLDKSIKYTRYDKNQNDLEED